MIANLAPCGLRLTLLISSTHVARDLRPPREQRTGPARAQPSFSGSGASYGLALSSAPKAPTCSDGSRQELCPNPTNGSDTSCRPTLNHHGWSRRDVRERAHEPLMNQRLAPAHPLSRARRAGPRRTQPRERRRASPHPRCLPARDPSNEGCACPQVVKTCGQSACAFSISAPIPNTDGIRRERGLGLTRTDNCQSEKGYTQRAWPGGRSASRAFCV
jgi:hypothetical protein